MTLHASPFMKTTKRKSWVKPSIKEVRIFFECTCYAGASDVEA